MVVVASLGLPGCGEDTIIAPEPEVGALAISVAGLPAGALAVMRLEGPGGFATRVAGALVLDNLRAGSYTAYPEPVITQLADYDPTAATVTATVRADSTASLQVDYAIATASLRAQVDSIPQEWPGAVYLLVKGPGDDPASENPPVTWNVAAGATLYRLTPGMYWISAPSLGIGSPCFCNFDPVPITQTVQLSASEDPVIVRVVYRSVD